MNKKGITFSIGMIVTIIIGILIFSLSLYFVFKWFGQAEELKAEIDKQTRQEILQALKTGNQLVAIPFSIQEAKRGNPVNYGIGVRNIKSTQQFGMQITYSGAYDPNGQPIQVSEPYVTSTWLGNFATIEPFTLQKNEQKVIPVLIKADPNIAQARSTPKGDYTFNLCVYEEPESKLPQYPPCTAGQYGNNPEAFYTNKIYQLVVKVI